MSDSCFVDTFALLAMLNPVDSHHAQAMAWLNEARRPLLTTEWILTELADGLSPVRTRAAAVAVASRLRANPRVTIVSSSSELFRRGIELFAQRPDKEWSLTDCISFVVMRDHDIADALTGDHHFEQAGFVALLR